MHPLVSVIIPFYNRGFALQRAIQSVQHQTYRNIEIVLVNDGSDEDILSLIQEAMTKDDIHYKYLWQQNAGPGTARALGLSNAQGDYILYLDSDDELLPETVEKLLGKLLAYPNAVMCYCQYKYIKPDGSELVLDYSSWQDMDLLELALNCRPWHTSACMWHYPDKQIARWPDIYGGEDIVHDVSVGIVNRNLLFVPEVLLIVHGGKDRLTSDTVLKYNRGRLVNDIVSVRTICYHLLSKSSLGKRRQYSLPFVERCFRGGIQLAAMGDVRRSLQCLQIAIQSSILPRQFIEIFAVMALVVVSFGKLPNLYRLYFKIHTKLTSPKIHCYKSPRI